MHIILLARFPKWGNPRGAVSRRRWGKPARRVLVAGEVRDRTASASVGVAPGRWFGHGMGALDFFPADDGGRLLSGGGSGKVFYSQSASGWVGWLGDCSPSDFPMVRRARRRLSGVGGPRAYLGWRSIGVRARWGERVPTDSIPGRCAVPDRRMPRGPVTIARMPKGGDRMVDRAPRIESSGCLTRDPRRL